MEIKQKDWKDWINATGDVVAGDVIRFTENVFSGSYRRPQFEGTRTITGRVVRDSYGDKKQQHTFTIEVFDCEGVSPIESGKVIRRKGRNVYRNGCLRQPWDDETARRAAVDEKHARGDKARRARQARRRFEEQEPWK